MEKYEVVLVQYPSADYPDNLWWTAVCPSMRGCVSDGQTRDDALMMIADAMALYLEEDPGWKVVILDKGQAQAEQETMLAEYREEGGIAEIHRVEPRFMTEEEIRNRPHCEPIELPLT